MPARCSHATCDRQLRSDNRSGWCRVHYVMPGDVKFRRREYERTRYQNDPDFRNAVNERVRRINRERYRSDSDYRERQRLKSKRRYAEEKADESNL